MDGAAEHHLVHLGRHHDEALERHAEREARERRFDIVREDDGAFRVNGVQVERMVVQTDWENEEAVTFLQHRMKRLGVDDALRKAGALDGDEIRILGYSFEYESPEGHVDVYQELDL